MKKISTFIYACVFAVINASFAFNANAAIDCQKEKTKNACKACCGNLSNTSADTPIWNAACKHKCDEKKL